MDDLTKSHNTGVRWQAQMEEHLTHVRTLTSEAMLPGIDPELAKVRAALAQAHGSAAAALATALAGSDVELALTRLADATTEAAA